MRDKQKIKHMKQRLRYVYTYEKGLNRGKLCEASKPKKVEIWIKVYGQIPAYANEGMHTLGLTCIRMLMTCVLGIVQKP